MVDLLQEFSIETIIIIVLSIYAFLKSGLKDVISIKKYKKNEEAEIEKRIRDEIAKETDAKRDVDKAFDRIRDIETIQGSLIEGLEVVTNLTKATNELVAQNKKHLNDIGSSRTIMAQFHLVQAESIEALLEAHTLCHAEDKKVTKLLDKFKQEKNLAFMRNNMKNSDFSEE